MKILFHEFFTILIAVFFLKWLYDFSCRFL